MKKSELISMMNALDFFIHDVKYLNGQELVGKKTQDGRIIYWSINVEGSGFERIFKGSIKNLDSSPI